MSRHTVAGLAGAVHPDVRVEGGDGLGITACLEPLQLLVQLGLRGCRFRLIATETAGHADHGRDPLRMLDGHVHRDLAALRVAHHDRTSDANGIEDGGQVRPVGIGDILGRRPAEAAPVVADDAVAPARSARVRRRPMPGCPRSPRATGRRVARSPPVGRTASPPAPSPSAPSPGHVGSGRRGHADAGCRCPASRPRCSGPNRSAARCAPIRRASATPAAPGSMPAPRRARPSDAAMGRS